MTLAYLSAIVFAICSSVLANAVDVKVSGSKLVDASGNTFRCRGANLQGTEYMCIQGTGFSASTINQTYVNALKSWDINCARIPLNEDCMLGSNIPGVTNHSYIGPAYLAALKNEVNILLENDIAVILDLHWVHGLDGATKQWSMSDKYTPQFWTVVAEHFSMPGVIFDLYNEPFVKSSDCWLNGGSACTADDQVVGWTASGMQDNINAVRRTGSTNPVLIQGLEYGANPTVLLNNTLSDPANQLIVGVHNYNFNLCITSDCWAQQYWPVLAKYPLMFGEIGENDCQHTYIDQLMAAADAHGVGYLGWAWFVGDCSKGPTLITSYDGTPTGMGIGLRQHYLKLGGSPNVTSAITTKSGSITNSSSSSSSSRRATSTSTTSGRRTSSSSIRRATSASKTTSIRRTVSTVRRRATSAPHKPH